jgi:thiosulfate reductase cytochrome b subunit
VVYAIHGVAAMALVTMVIIHVYFALRPDEWHLTRSMLRGWITGKEYRDHHDPRRWPAKD